MLYADSLLHSCECCYSVHSGTHSQCPVPLCPTSSHHTWSTFILRPPLYRPAPHLFHTSPFGSVTQLVTSGLNSRRRWAGKERGGEEELHNDTLRCKQTGGTSHKDCQLAKPDTRHFSVHMHVHTYVCTHLSSSEGKLKEQRGKGGGREVDWFLST